jgi:oxygen-independent coproporphyrinogen-3 oxidase
MLAASVRICLDRNQGRVFALNQGNFREASHDAGMTHAADLLSARVPRYTSYPTAPHFHKGVTAEIYESWLRAIPASMPLSLYLHVPFCDTLCWFCGCHTKIVNNYTPVSGYLDLLLREIDMLAAILGSGRPVSHIHWGGGSPTILSPEDIRKLSGRLRERFQVQKDAEFAIEVDPRGLSEETVHALKQAGVTRVSIGVQDCDEAVQRAINRIQPFAVTEKACAMFRAEGIEAINIDLIYGLPHQTEDSLERTIRACLTLDPQRFAVFGYAHVPHFKKHQNLIPEAALPSAEQRLIQFELAQRLLNEAGYVSVGLDHFARYDDPLAIVQTRGALHRNFQGYTTDGAGVLIGMGLSSIGALPQGYVQNSPDFNLYRDAIQNGKLPVVRGIALGNEDRMRAKVIEKLMCDLSVDVAQVAAEFGAASDYFAGELEDLYPFEAEGLVCVSGNKVSIPTRWRVAVRLICSVFDSYLSGQSKHALAV